MSDCLGINILFPVLNERLRLRSGIERTMEFIRENMDVPCALTILDNGSDDETPQIGKELAQKYPEVTYVRLEQKGVGAAFRKGIELNQCEIVGYMDIDLSTDIKYLSKTVKLFQEDDMLVYINGTRFSKNSDTRGRKWYRKITSMGLIILLKACFQMKATDAICGFTFLRKSTAEKLVKQCSDDNGWFYMIELLLRAERSGIKIHDMPIEWQEDYNTTVKIWKTIKNYIIQIIKLKRTFKKEKYYVKKN